ncbi:Hemolysin IA [Marinibacterium anthonyi]|nr:Hemolysin IA [Marinibacterium anthonyi]
MDSFDTITYFGDSLTDDGNYYEIIYGYPADPSLNAVDPYFNIGPYGALTNEYAHSTYLQQLTGASTENHAVVGACAVGSNVITPSSWGVDTPPTDINLAAQVGRFLDDHHASTGPGSAAIVFIGSNDAAGVFGAQYTPGDEGTAAFNAMAAARLGAMIGEVLDSVRTIAQAGVEVTFLGTLPTCDFYPPLDTYNDQTRASFDSIIHGFNAGLDGIAAGLRTEGIDVRIIDYGALCAAMTDDATSFGVIAPRGSVLIAGTQGYDPAQFAFWNGYHPAEAYQKAWAALDAFTLDDGTTTRLSDSRDRFTDNDAAALTLGLGGDDLLWLGGGDDVGLGGSGNDVILGQDGDDHAIGGAGNDLLRGLSGNDFLGGGEGNDILTGGHGRDVLFGGTGSDILRGGNDDDVFIHVAPELIGGSGVDLDVIVGGAGDDALYLVLTSDTAAQYRAGQITLEDLGLSLHSIEDIIVIDGAADGALDDAFGDMGWYDMADMWGFV